jgi:Sec1 family
VGVSYFLFSAITCSLVFVHRVLNLPCPIFILLFSSEDTSLPSDLISPPTLLPSFLFLRLYLLLISSISSQLFSLYSLSLPLPPLCLSKDCLVSDRPRPLLLIFDRSCDMFPPLMHTSTYQVHSSGFNLDHCRFLMCVLYKFFLLQRCCSAGTRNASMSNSPLAHSLLPFVHSTLMLSPP